MIVSLPPHISPMLVKVLFSCSHSSPYMALGLIHVQNLPRFPRQRRIDLEEPRWEKLNREHTHYKYLFNKVIFSLDIYYTFHEYIHFHLPTGLHGLLITHQINMKKDLHKSFLEISLP